MIVAECGPGQNKLRQARILEVPIFKRHFRVGLCNMHEAAGNRDGKFRQRTSYHTAIRGLAKC